MVQRKTTQSHHYYAVYTCAYRFFYNMGVQQARLMLMGRAYQDFPHKAQMSANAAGQLAQQQANLNVAQNALQSLVNPTTINLVRE